MAEIWVGHVTANNSKAEARQKNQMRTIYLYEEAKEENWEEFAVEVDNQLSWKKVIRDMMEINEAHRHNIEELNLIWDAIEGAILEAASKQIPKKKVLNIKTNRRQNQKMQQQHRHIAELQRIIKRAKKERGKVVEKEERIDVNSKLVSIGVEMGVTLPELHRWWSDAWIEDIRGWQGVFRKIRKEEWELAQRKKIEESIDKRCEMIKTDQGRMLASLLNRPYKKIVLDRFMKQEEENKILVTDPEAVKCGIAAHFKEQFRKRKTCLEEMTEEWMKIYTPREWIDAAWYEEVEGKIKEEEWEETLRELKIGTAPGISGISYILIKRAGKEAQKVFRTFADICLNLGEVPEK